MRSSANNPWLVVPKPNRQADIRMFCLPFAGGGASIFRKWLGYTTTDFTMHFFEGDHFFIQSSQRLVLPIIDFVLASVIGSNRNFFLAGQAEEAEVERGVI